MLQSQGNSEFKDKISIFLMSQKSRNFTNKNSRYFNEEEEENPISIYIKKKLTSGLLKNISDSENNNEGYKSQNNNASMKKHNEKKHSVLVTNCEETHNPKLYCKNKKHESNLNDSIAKRKRHRDGKFLSILSEDAGGDTNVNAVMIDKDCSVYTFKQPKNNFFEKDQNYNKKNLTQNQLNKGSFLNSNMSSIDLSFNSNGTTHKIHDMKSNYNVDQGLVVSLIQKTPKKKLSNFRINLPENDFNNNNTNNINKPEQSKESSKEKTPVIRIWSKEFNPNEKAYYITPKNLDVISNSIYCDELEFAKEKSFSVEKNLNKLSSGYLKKFTYKTDIDSLIELNRLSTEKINAASASNKNLKKNSFNSNNREGIKKNVISIDNLPQQKENELLVDPPIKPIRDKLKSNNWEYSERDNLMLKEDSFIESISSRLNENNQIEFLDHKTNENLYNFNSNLTKEISSSLRDYKEESSVKAGPDNNRRDNMNVKETKFCEVTLTEKKNFTRLKKVYDSLSENEERKRKKINALYISPNSDFKIFFDFLVFITCAYSIIYTPVHLVLNAKTNFFSVLLEIVFDAVIIFDFILGFFTAYYDLEENLKTSFSKKLGNYLRTYFLIDLISIPPVNSICEWEVYFSSSSSSLIKGENANASFNFIFSLNKGKAYRIFKVLRIFKCFKMFTQNAFLKKHISKDSILKGGNLKIFSFYIYFFVISHVLTCIFIFLGTVDFPSWIISAGFQDAHLLELYLNSLYFNHTTIFTVGYGDILSKHYNERMYNVMLMIVGIMLYSFALTSISNIIKQKAEKRKEYENKKDYLNSLYDTYFISDKLYQKLKRHLYHQMKQDKHNITDFLNNLPISSRNEMILNMHRRMISSFSFFRDCSDNDFIIQVIMALKPTKSVRNDVLVKQGDFIEEIIFVNSGIVQLETVMNINGNGEIKGNNSDFFQSDDIDFPLGEGEIERIKIMQLQKNEHFGDILMIENRRSSFTLVTKSKIAELYLLNRVDVISLLDNFTSIFEKIYEKSSHNFSGIIAKSEIKKRNRINIKRGIKNPVTHSSPRLPLPTNTDEFQDDILHDPMIIAENDLIKVENNKILQSKKNIQSSLRQKEFDIVTTQSSKVDSDADQLSPISNQIHTSFRKSKTTQIQNLFKQEKKKIKKPKPQKKSANSKFSYRGKRTFHNANPIININNYNNQTFKTININIEKNKKTEESLSQVIPNECSTSENRPIQVNEINNIYPIYKNNQNKIQNQIICLQEENSESDSRKYSNYNYVNIESILKIENYCNALSICKIPDYLNDNTSNDFNYNSKILTFEKVRELNTLKFSPDRSPKSIKNQSLFMDPNTNLIKEGDGDFLIKDLKTNSKQLNRNDSHGNIIKKESYNNLDKKGNEKLNEVSDKNSTDVSLCYCCSKELDERKKTYKKSEYEKYQTDILFIEKADNLSIIPSPILGEKKKTKAESRKSKSSKIDSLYKVSTIKDSNNSKEKKRESLFGKNTRKLTIRDHLNSASFSKYRSISSSKHSQMLNSLKNTNVNNTNNNNNFKPIEKSQAKSKFNEKYSNLAVVNPFQIFGDLIKFKNKLIEKKKPENNRNNNCSKGDLEKCLEIYDFVSESSINLEGLGYKDNEDSGNKHKNESENEKNFSLNENKGDEKKNFSAQIKPEPGRRSQEVTTHFNFKPNENECNLNSKSPLFKQRFINKKSDLKNEKSEFILKQFVKLDKKLEIIFKKIKI